MLSHYRQRIHELEPLKAMLITVSEQCDQKIMKIREEVGILSIILAIIFKG